VTSTTQELHDADRHETEQGSSGPQTPDRGEIVSRIADTIGRRASVATVFGEPITQGNVAVIPVARVAWGFGGHRIAARTGGHTSQESDTPGRIRAPWMWRVARRPNAGGGGGARLQPLGYIVLRDGDAEFRPIRWVPPLVIGLIGLLIGMRLAGALRRR
jgi:uncharacterized spore protein YtfJ